MTKPPTRVRLTITVTPETHEAFQLLADTAGVSIGRAMGDWLGDQLPAVGWATVQMEEARAVPRGLSDKLIPALSRKRAERPEAARGAPAERGGPGRAQGGPSPRPVIRGGKSPDRGDE